MPKLITPSDAVTKNVEISEKLERNSLMFSRTYTHNKLINLTRNKVTIQSNNCTALPTWVNQNLLTNIIPGIRSSTVNSFTGPLYKILAAGRTQGWTILDHAWTHQVCSVLPTEWDREWQKKGKPYAWGKGIYIHPPKKKKNPFPLYLCNTEHNISIQILVYSP